MYVITAVPAVIPLTSPRKLTDATALALLQIPPLVGLPSIMVLPTHTVPDPLIGIGRPSTVTVAVLAQPVGSV
jgi:hypothetical protein